MNELFLEDNVIHGSNVTLVKILGYVDAHTYRQLEQCLTDLLSAGKFRIIIDLSKVRCISSPGVCVILNAICEINLHRGKVVLLRPNDDVQDVLDSMGFSELVDISASLADALSWFHPDGAARHVQAIPLH